MLETFLTTLTDPMAIVSTLGLIGVLAIIFAESGLFFGFFLPGDSLLFTAGFLASQGLLNIWWLSIGAMAAAIVGDSVGYWFGKKVGPRIFTREDSLFFHKKHVEKTRTFYQVHGKKTLILARFIPVIRTFAPILAGVGQMEYKTFLTYNVVGGILWGGGLTWGGYLLGSIIPNVDQYLWPIIFLIIFVSFIPVFKHLFTK